ncbi:MAG: hypothetical protein AAGK14_04275 [Verrucomicrobiota bacterium]
MPFPSEDILVRFREGRDKGRLGHAYLLTGEEPDRLLELALELAAIALGESPAEHPDFYLVRPGSKSRRLTVQQIRGLEKSLYLKAFRAPVKVAVIQEADRMCLGQAEAANAFLKTLEEPPERTLLLLTSARPALVLPTIRSRCLRLDRLEPPPEGPGEGPPAALAEAWFGARFGGAARAYERAGILQMHWRGRRVAIQEAVKSGADESLTDEEMAALVEGEFVLARAESIAALQRAYWQRSRGQDEETEPAANAILALEELQQAMQTNVQPDLAVERACLKLEGLV